MIKALSCFAGRLRRAMQPVAETDEERALSSAIDENVRAAQRGARAAQALEETIKLVRDHAHAVRR